MMFSISFGMTKLAWLRLFCHSTNFKSNVDGEFKDRQIIKRFGKIVIFRFLYSCKLSFVYKFRD